MNVSRQALYTIILLLSFGHVSSLQALAAPQLEYLSDDVFVETDNKIMWQAQQSRRFKEPEEVEAYIRELNSNSEYSDWRLPTKLELYRLHSIFDLKNSGPVKIRIEGKYWYVDEANTPHVGSWEIGDQCGPSRSFYDGKSGVVRALRP